MKSRMGPLTQRHVWDPGEGCESFARLQVPEAATT